MRRSIQLGGMKIKSYNRSLGRSWQAHKGARAKVRKELEKAFASTGFRPPPLTTDGGRSNSFVVWLVRISHGEVDDHENLRTGWKAHVDFLADWLGLPNDRDRRVEWRYRQQHCERGRYAARITIDDEEPGDEVRKVVGANPAVLGPAPETSAGSDPRGGGVDRMGQGERPEDDRGRAANAPGDGRHPRRGGARPPRPPAARQRSLVFRPVYALLPWDQDGGDPVVTELEQFGDGIDVPETLRVRIPPQHLSATVTEFGAAVAGAGPGAGCTLLLWRHPYRAEGLGGEVWMFMPDRPEAVQAGHQADPHSGDGGRRR